MSYKVSYEDTMVLIPIIDSKRKLVSLKTATIAIWLLVAGVILWQNKSVVVDCLIPGDNTVTVTAFDNLVENVSGGMDFTDSVAVFCKEILFHAQIQV